MTMAEKMKKLMIDSQTIKNERDYQGILDAIEGESRSGSGTLVLSVFDCPLFLRNRLISEGFTVEDWGLYDVRIRWCNTSSDVGSK